MQVKGNNKENYFQNDYRIHWHENRERSNKYFLNLEKRKHVKIQCRNWKLMALVGLHNNNTNTGKYNLFWVVHCYFPPLTTSSLILQKNVCPELNIFSLPRMTRLQPLISSTAFLQNINFPWPQKKLNRLWVSNK